MDSLRKALISIVLTFVVYNFFYIKIISENIEDFSFDIINNYIFSFQEEKVDAPNLLLFKVDNNYLKEKSLLDKNKETTYGYLFPRVYLAEIISKFDSLLEEIEKEYYPSSLFIDYDISYKSDPHNITYTQDDLKLIEVLKKERAYTIYLTKTANNNYIENFDDEVLQKKIKNKEIVFVSTGLTVSNDNISRRYYPYENYISKDGKEIKYPLVEIEIFKNIKNLQENVINNFSQDKIALIENRIIFKDYEKQKIVNNSELIQSKWQNLKLFSANYDLDDIPKENFKNAIIYLGGTHSNSDDIFVKDSYDRELSGIEMHANVLMTMFYLDGKLDRLNIYFSIFIIGFIVFFSDMFMKFLFKGNKKEDELIIKIKEEEFIFEVNKDGIMVKAKEDSFINKFKDDGYIFLTISILFLISYYLLIEYKVWFNWFIPSLMTTIIPILTTSFIFLKKKNITKIIRILFLIFIFEFIINKLKKGEEK
jgi:CHASE2 domain-containing sensor protein